MKNTARKASAKVRGGHFGRGLFEFFAELRANNDREWFDAHKQRFVDEVEAPMQRFITDFGERLGKISKHFVADPRRVGGSMLRIYRDTRFSKDKTPFKTATGAHFTHQARAKEQSVPGFYIHLEPGECVGGGGIYHPDAAALKQIRDRMVAKPRDWEAVLRKKLPLGGEALKRPPAGYEPEHRFVEDLKRKDFYSLTTFTEKEVCAPDFLDTYVDACVRVAPLIQFLSRSLGLSY